MGRIDSAVNSAGLMNRLDTVAGGRAAASRFASTSAAAAGEEKTARSDGAKPTTEELLKKLNEYIEKGPVVAMREKILKSMGLTEDELKTLPPDEQNAIEAEIAKRIKEMLLEQQEAKNTPQKSDQATTMAAAFWAASAKSAI